MKIQIKSKKDLQTILSIIVDKEEISQEADIPEQLNYRNISYSSESEAQKMDIYLIVMINLQKRL